MSSASIISSNADDTTQSVPKVPNDSHARRFVPIAPARTEYTIGIVPAGTTRAIATSASAKKSGTGMYAITAESKISAGNIQRIE